MPSPLSVYLIVFENGVFHDLADESIHASMAKDLLKINSRIEQLVFSCEMSSFCMLY